MCFRKQFILAKEELSVDEKPMVDEQQQNSQGGQIKDLILRAIQEPEFKALLVQDPDRAMEGYELTETQKMLVKTLRPEDLEKLTPENLEEYFSADSAVYTPDLEAELQPDKAEEDDI
jgi:hypothetical protein